MRVWTIPYCNFILYGTPQSTLSKLQHVHWLESFSSSQNKHMLIHICTRVTGCPSSNVSTVSRLNLPIRSEPYQRHTIWANWFTSHHGDQKVVAISVTYTNECTVNKNGHCELRFQCMCTSGVEQFTWHCPILRLFKNFQDKTENNIFI